MVEHTEKTKRTKIRWIFIFIISLLIISMLTLGTYFNSKTPYVVTLDRNTDISKPLVPKQEEIPSKPEEKPYSEETPPSI